MSIATIPNVFYEFAFNADPNQSQLPPYWQDLSARVQFAWTASQGGRQYELDTNEAGTWQPVLANPDGALDPSNTASPFAPGLKLYRGCRIRVPLAPTQNLLPRAAAAPDVVGSASAIGAWRADAGTVGYATNLTAAPSGQTSAVTWTTPAGTNSNPNLWVGTETGGSTSSASPSQDNVQVAAGSSYTVTFYAQRAASADATLAVTLGVAWFTASGTFLSSSRLAQTALTTSWNRLVLTATAPAGAVWGRTFLFISTPATTTATNVIYLTGGQFEQAGAATAWADPGLTRFLFTGGAERWTQTWTELDGTYGTAAPIGVDAFAGLSLPTLLAPFVNEVLAMGPNFFYQLAEPQGSTACTDSAGKRPPAPVENSPYGVGSLVFGNSITAATPSTGGFLGAAGPVATFNNNPSNASPFQLAETFVSLHKTTVTPGPPTGTAWTRAIAFRAPTVPGAGNLFGLWIAVPGTYNTANQSLFQIALNASGFAYLRVQDATGGNASWTGSANLCDGNWHMIAIGADPVAGTVNMWVDNVLTITVTGIGTTSAFVTDALGCAIEAGVTLYADGYIGDLSQAIEFPFQFTASQMANLYNSWRNASAGESTDARYRRVLTWIGYAGPTAIDTGATSSMGPATDLTGTTVLDALNLIATTENGDSYVSPAGVLTFKARTARYNSRTPAFTFGENTGGGEWPCEVTAVDYDPAHLANNVQVTQYNGPIATATNAASARSYYPRTYQRTINVSSVNEATDAANYLLGRYKDPHLRTEVIRLHPSAVPGLFAVCAQLEKGMRIRVNRRPINAPAITVDCFVEQVHWSWDPNTGDVWCEIQASPADLANYWVLAALHTTLSAQATSGTNTATINALQDAATNKLAQSLPSGYSLTFEPGTSRQETLAIAPAGIPSTSLGYSTATLTFSSNFAFTHAIGSTVCEPLPTGYTNPATWDASSVLGAASTTVSSGGGSGTNTVTVNALPDSKANALGSDWNTGDVIWLSPGTANFESATVLSVAASYPGYSTCQITLTANLAHSHAVGDIVCDPLPAGVTNPAALSPTTRAAY